MTGPVVHWEIGAQDAARLRRFYSDLFGWRITGDEEYGLVEREDGGIGGGIMQTSAGTPGYVTVYIGVDDLAAAIDRAIELGGTQIVEPRPISGFGSFAMIADPEGHTIGLMAETPTPPDPSTTSEVQSS
ncbi:MULTISPECIES: VOC family protein [Microbacterium]|uniref:VOC family protein n=1 Tax=Microbacterium TaxID=33882 RepID=UPI00146ED533|nr:MULTISPECIES: VOC family protein [Microbacterium]